MNKVDLPEEIYDVTASGHLGRAVLLRNRFIKINPMQFGLYAALELRNAIERLLFEYLVLIHGEKISKNLEKEYRADSLSRRIEAVEPELQKKIEYMNLMLRAVDMPLAVVPNLDALSNLYGCLNNYLHAWKRPQNTARKRAWWSKLWQVLDEAERMLTQILTGTIGHVNLNDKGWQSYEAWKNKELSDEEVITAFRRELQKQ